MEFFHFWRARGALPQLDKSDFYLPHQHHRMQSSGVITVVQEHRFELLGEDGTRRHFTLAHDAPLGWNELIALQHDGCRVAVQHDEPRPGHTTAAVHAIGRVRSPALARESQTRTTT
jgi:hypothetical protein